MLRSARPSLLGYALVPVAIVMALVLRYPLGPWIGNELRYLLLFPAVTLCAWIGGLGPGLLATVLSSVAVAFFLLPPYGNFEGASPRDVAGLGLFVVVSVVISLLSEVVRRYRHRLELLTEQAASERELLRERNQARLRCLVEEAHVGIVMADAAGVWTEANQAMLRLLRRARAELTTRSLTWASLTPPDYAWKDTEALDELLRTGRMPPREKELLRSDGSSVPVLVSAATLPEGPGQFVYFVVDLSEHKQVEDHLRLSEERYRLAIQAVSGIMYDWDLVSGYVERSPGLSSVTGFRLEDAQPQRDWWLARVHPDDVECFQAAISEAIAGDEPGYDVEYRVRHRDGSCRHVWDRGLIIRNEAGKAVRIVGNILDVSDRKRLEAALQQADRRKDEFLAMLAHELRNPLAAVRNALHILEKADANPLVAEVTQLLRRQLTQMTRLVDDLMDVSRIARGKIELRRERVALATIVETAVEATGPLIDQLGHKLIVDLPPEPVVFHADAARLAQVLANLLNNAAKYTPSGGHIWLTATLVDGELCVSVRDDGLGMAPEMLPRIFDLFAQADDSLPHAQGGIGVGLAVVRALVQLHGGRISVQSDGPGCGSEFLVYLPLGTAAPAGKQEPSPNRALLV